MSHASAVDAQVTWLDVPADDRCPVTVFTQENLGKLNHLRIAALNCRCSARAEVNEACRVLSSDVVVSRGAYADVLVRCLSQVLGRSVRFLAPGVVELSDDEAWLLRLIVSIEDEDHMSSQFLLRSRVPKHMRRTMRFLARGVSDAGKN